MIKPRTCYNAQGGHKQSFSTKAEAKRYKRKWLEIYPCSNCSFFHFASKK